VRKPRVEPLLGGPAPRDGGGLLARLVRLDERVVRRRLQPEHHPHKRRQLDAAVGARVRSVERADLARVRAAHELVDQRAEAALADGAVARARHAPRDRRERPPRLPRRRRPALERVAHELLELWALADLARSRPKRRDFNNGPSSCRDSL
jgi:hypothetical protein